MNGDTKLSEALKLSPDILEYVISLNPHDFARLRNPLMRKVMPVRISLRRLASMVKISEQEFVNKLNDLAGLPHEQIDSERQPPSIIEEEMPDWMHNVDETKLRWADVLAGDERLDDPMPPINVVTNSMQPGDVVGVKHKWQPEPLYDIWEKRGYKYWAVQISEDEWNIFVHRP